MQDEVLISTNNICKRFGEKRILNGIDLDIKKGERVVIIGPSGSGKSTFLRCLNLLEPPTTGTIKFEGNTIFDISSVLIADEMADLKNKIAAAKAEKSLQNRDIVEKHKEDLAKLKAIFKTQREKERAADNILSKTINMHRQKIGMVFQQFNLFPHLTVMQNITLAPVKLGKMDLPAATEKAMQYLKRIGLTEKADAYPAQLSGGQMQRIAIVRSLVMSPDVMLFDEPTSALDPEMVGEVLDFIIELAGEGMTMAIVTHEMSFAKKIGTKIIFIDEGKIVETGEPKKFFDNPQSPRLKEFLKRVLSIDFDDNKVENKHIE